MASAHWASDEDEWRPKVGESNSSVALSYAPHLFPLMFSYSLVIHWDGVIVVSPILQDRLAQYLLQVYLKHLVWEFQPLVNGHIIYGSLHCIYLPTETLCGVQEDEHMLVYTMGQQPPLPSESWLDQGRMCQLPEAL